jgi:inner membrane protein
MASAFGHALTAVALGSSYPKRMTNWKFWFLGIICSILPDADVLSFKLGIPYDSFWGHRGFSHSLLFALVIGVIISFSFFRKDLLSIKGVGYIFFFFICTASHSILDAMTNGGLGVAFFSPWDEARYFFSWRPIKVSPIGIENFFSDWGKRVVLSELIWIGIPCFSYILLNTMVNKILPKVSDKKRVTYIQPQSLPNSDKPNKKY